MTVEATEMDSGWTRSCRGASIVSEADPRIAKEGMVFRPRRLIPVAIAPAVLPAREGSTSKARGDEWSPRYEALRRTAERRQGRGQGRNGGREAGRRGDGGGRRGPHVGHQVGQEGAGPGQGGNLEE